jgi:hypothetical protein
MVGDFSSAELARRIGVARAYYLALGAFSRLTNLSATLKSVEALSLPQKYALLHPELYRDVVPIEDILGKRSFSGSGIHSGSTCMCDQLWGYACEFSDRPMHQDHMFPYALGGATNPGNLLTLCDVHNLAKGHDIHVYPWPIEPPVWVEEAIVRLRYIYPR